MPGYHINHIPKGILGESSKIYEEFCEFVDAHSQQVVVMELIELSDLLGAISFYVQKHFSESDWNQILQKFSQKEKTQKNIEYFQLVNDFYQFYHHLEKIESFYIFSKSISSYIQPYFLSISDLWSMNLITQRAFLNGERSS